MNESLVISPSGEEGVLGIVEYGRKFGSVAGKEMRDGSLYPEE